MKSTAVQAAVAVLLLASLCVLTWQTAGADPQVPEPITVHVFEDNAIHYSLENPDAYATPLVSSEDNGRVISRAVSLPDPKFPVKIMARVVTRPVPADEAHVCDSYDRSGNVRLSVRGKPDIEVVKFITAYGGETEHAVDVSHLATVLHGDCTFKGFVDTWLSPAWKMDFSLTYQPVEQEDHPDWVAPLLYEEWLTEEMLGEGPITVRVSIPRRLHKVVMNYLPSGHCTNGIGAEEFVTRDNVITVDGTEVYRYRPWREDCIRFRDVNPYCTRWSDGQWSSTLDQGRSGWCPGDMVAPEVIDLTDHLSPGRHTISFYVENVRPKDDQGHLGYWRVSAHLLGYRD